MADCNTCKEKKKSLEPVPYLAHEAEMARLERTANENAKRQAETNKRLWIVVIILIAALILSNAAWIYRESQFETVETKEVTQDVDTGDGTAIVSGIGDVNYGESETDSQNNETPSP